MTQIVINKIPTSMTFMNDQKYLLVVLPVYSCSQESPEFGKQFFAPTDFEGCDYAADLITSKLNNSLRENYLDILNKVHSNYN